MQKLSKRIASRIWFEMHRLRARRNEKWWLKHFGTDRQKVLRLPNGQHLMLYADSVLCRTLDIQPFEDLERMFVSNYLNEGEVFFDVGANIGLFSVPAAHKVGKLGAVHGFEPCGKTFKRLTGNIERNHLNNVTAVNKGLSGSPGNLRLFVSNDGHDAWNSFAGGVAEKKGVTEDVSVTTLDDYIAASGVVPNLIKIDVEGWEREVIKGGTALLSKADAPELLVEFTAKNCEHAGTSAIQLYKDIESLGYELFELRRDSKLVRATEACDFTYCNLLATKRPDLLRERGFSVG